MTATTSRLQARTKNRAVTNDEARTDNQVFHIFQGGSADRNGVPRSDLPVGAGRCDNRRAHGAFVVGDIRIFGRRYGRRLHLSANAAICHSFRRRRRGNVFGHYGHDCGRRALRSDSHAADEADKLPRATRFYGIGTVCGAARDIRRAHDSGGYARRRIRIRTERVGMVQYCALCSGDVRFHARCRIV